MEEKTPNGQGPGAVHRLADWPDGTKTADGVRATGEFWGGLPAYEDPRMPPMTVYLIGSLKLRA